MLSPYLSKVSFVPNASYKGTVTISYTGYGEDGGSYTGNITILVKGGIRPLSAMWTTATTGPANAIDYLYLKTDHLRHGNKYV
jgi:hypothetical protein